MAKVLREVTHPSFDDYSKGDIVEFDNEDAISERFKSFSKPYTEKKVTKKAAPKK